MMKVSETRKESLSDNQFDSFGKEHTEVTKYDPSKQYVHYPSVISLLGDVNDKTLLDIGCGDGIVARDLSRKGGKVTGYDIAPAQIWLAKSYETEKGTHPIRYSVNSQHTFVHPTPFDLAFSVLVLPYALNFEDLKVFFSSTYEITGATSPFISVIFNPEFKRFEETNYRRKFVKKEQNIFIDFYDDLDKYYFTSKISNFSKSQYEEAARMAGYKNVQWIDLRISEEGIDTMGKAFWAGYEEDCPYVAIICSK